MACNCAKRRKALLAKSARKRLEGKTAQAAVIGAFVAITDAANAAIGREIGEEDGERTSRGVEQHR